MDFNGLNRCFFYRTYQTYQTYQTYRTPKLVGLLTCWLVDLLARRLVGLLTCRPVDLRCGYSDMKESLKPRK